MRLILAFLLVACLSARAAVPPPVERNPFTTNDSPNALGLSTNIAKGQGTIVSNGIINLHGAQIAYLSNLVNITSNGISSRITITSNGIVSLHGPQIAGLSNDLAFSSNYLWGLIQALTGGGATLADITNIARAFDLVTSNGLISIHGPQIAYLSNLVTTTSNGIVSIYGPQVASLSNQVTAASNFLYGVNSTSSNFLYGVNSASSNFLFSVNSASSNAAYNANSASSNYLHGLIQATSNGIVNLYGPQVAWLSNAVAGMIGLTNGVNVLWYGAKGDGIEFSAAISSNSIYVTNLSCTWTTNLTLANEAGKFVHIHGADITNASFTAWITNVTSSNVFVVNLKASNTVTAAYAVYGHNDAYKIQDAIDFSDRNGGLTVQLPGARTYLLLNTNFIDMTNGYLQSITLNIRSNNTWLAGINGKPRLHALGGFRRASWNDGYHGIIRRQTILKLGPDAPDIHPDGITNVRISNIEFFSGITNAHTVDAGFPPANAVTGDGWDGTHRAIVMYYGSPHNITIEDCNIHGFKGEQVYNGTEDAGDLILIHNEIWDGTASLVNLNGSQYWYRNKLHDCNIGTEFGQFRNGRNVIHENQFWNLVTCFVQSGSRTNTINSIDFRANEYWNFSTRGIGLGNAQNVTMIGEYFHHFAPSGVAIQVIGAGLQPQDEFGNVTGNLFNRYINGTGFRIHNTNNSGFAFDLGGNIRDSEFSGGDLRGLSSIAIGWYGGVSNVTFSGFYFDGNSGYHRGSPVSPENPRFVGNRYATPYIDGNWIAADYTGDSNVVLHLDVQAEFAFLAGFAHYDFTINTTNVPDGQIVRIGSVDGADGPTHHGYRIVSTSSNALNSPFRVIRNRGDWLTMKFYKSDNVWRELSYETDRSWFLSSAAPSSGWFWAGERVLSPDGMYEHLCVTSGIPAVFITRPVTAPITEVLAGTNVVVTKTTTNATNFFVVSSTSSGSVSLSDVTNIANTYDLVTSNGLVSIYGPQVAFLSNAVNSKLDTTNGLARGSLSLNSNVTSSAFSVRSDATNEFLAVFDWRGNSIGTLSTNGTLTISNLSTINFYANLFFLTNGLTPDNGGTGLTNITNGFIIVGNGTNTPTLLGGVSAGQVVTWNGTAWVASNAPAGGGSSYNIRGTNGATTVSNSSMVVISSDFRPGSNISLTTNAGGSITIAVTGIAGGADIAANTAIVTNRYQQLPKYITNTSPICVIDGSQNNRYVVVLDTNTVIIPSNFLNNADVTIEVAQRTNTCFTLAITNGVYRASSAFIAGVQTNGNALFHFKISGPYQTNLSLMTALTNEVAAANWGGVPAAGAGDYLTYLSRWYHAQTNAYTDSGSTPVASNDDEVQQWNDLMSSENATASASFYRPKWKTNVQNGKPGVYFDETDNLTLPDLVMGDFHIFMAIKLGTIDNSFRTAFGYDNYPSTPRDAILMQVDNTEWTFGVGANGTFDYIQPNSPAPSSSSVWLIEMERVGTTCKLYTNGVQAGSSFTTGSGSRTFVGGRFGSHFHSSSENEPLQYYNFETRIYTNATDINVTQIRTNMNLFWQLYTP